MLGEQEFYNAVGKINGWNFSHLRKLVKGETWDFFEQVKTLCEVRDFLLDIGTGGGEHALKIASSVKQVHGIDASKEMINVAKGNTQQSLTKNAVFSVMNSEQLGFPTESFDIVTSRHCPFNAIEVRRVLKPGGVFLTQQVSERDAWNFKKLFGRGQAYESRDGILKDKYIAELKRAGFSKIEVKEYDADIFYQTPEDVLFLLMHTPIIPGFGESENDQQLFTELINEYSTPNGIVTNEKRFMLIAR